MKVLKKKWILFYGKVLSAVIALLGLVSACSLFRKAQPVMYGIPDPGYNPADTVKPNPGGRQEYKLMYGVAPVKYEKNPAIEQDGVNIEIKK
ncbi:MAG: hypothetical protein IJ635_01410 [Bacteroidaceae bacterium]|nr:hypothetical protein [Bacteroidaceae bacterium]